MMKDLSYKVLESTNPRKRVCLTCDLKNDPDLIDQYVEYHRRENNWPEINNGIKASGIQLMDIYLLDNRMFMICEVDEKMDLDECLAKIGTYPRQKEWGELMRKFQQAVPGHSFGWIQMKRVYSLP